MRLFRFDYSCYARKAQMALDLCGADYEIVDVPYGDREDLATRTGGLIKYGLRVRGRHCDHQAR